MLKSEAEADKCKALLTFELISKHPSGIGDHSTSDFWDNATQALKLLASADERLETLEKYLHAMEDVVMIVEGSDMTSETLYHRSI